MLSVNTPPVTMKTCNFRRFAVSDINMAFNQMTFMSSEFRINQCQAGCPSRRAVDGDRSTSTTRCSITTLEDDPWWAVELLRDDNIAKVVITNGGRNEPHLAGFMSYRCMRHRDDCNTSIDFQKSQI